jgi:hypothetical protein
MRPPPHPLADAMPGAAAEVPAAHAAAEVVAGAAVDLDAALAHALADRAEPVVLRRTLRFRAAAGDLPLPTALDLEQVRHRNLAAPEMERVGGDVLCGAAGDGWSRSSDRQRWTVSARRAYLSTVSRSSTSTLRI